MAHSPSADEDQAAIDAQLEQACLAEAVGFDGVWLTEHNFTGEAVYCDPIPFAAALAARTTRIRIGFAVIQLALRHPVRLAVQLALLDNLSRWETGALCGTARRVTEQLRELEGVGVGHVLCQMSFGYLGHAQIAASMRRFGAEVMPAFHR